MTKDEALKLAYDETWSAGSEYPIPSFDDVMSFANKLEAIKEALAQQALDKKAENARELGLDYEPVQEPVAWHTEDHLTDRSATTYSKDMAYRWECKGWPVTPLYTTPPQRKPLTDEEIGAILEDINAFGTRLYTFARAIEAAHGIKV